MVVCGHRLKFSSSRQSVFPFLPILSFTLIRLSAHPSVRPSVVVIVFLVSIVLVIVVVIVIIVVIVVFPPTSPILLIGRIASPSDGMTDGWMDWL